MTDLPRTTPHGNARPVRASTRGATFLFASFVALSGCLAAPDGTDASSVPGTDAAVPEPPPLVASGCDAIWLMRYLPSELVTVSSPPGWEQDMEMPAIEARIEGWQCEDVTLGPFAGGPVSIFVESHDHGDPPPACLGEGDDWDLYAIGYQLWTDSPALAENMSRLLDVDVSVSESARVYWLANTGGAADWRIGDGGGHFEVDQPWITQGVMEHSVHRLALFPSGGGVTLLDFVERDIHVAWQGPATGTLTAPHLTVPGEAAASAAQGSAARSDLEIRSQSFTAMDCKE